MDQLIEIILPTVHIQIIGQSFSWNEFVLGNFQKIVSSQREAFLLVLNQTSASAKQSAFMAALAKHRGSGKAGALPQPRHSKFVQGKLQGNVLCKVVDVLFTVCKTDSISFPGTTSPTPPKVAGATDHTCDSPTSHPKRSCAISQEPCPIRSNHCCAEFGGNFAIDFSGNKF